MKRKRWKKDEIIELTIRKEEELGHFPSVEELNADSELTSYVTILNNFGGMTELRKEVETIKEQRGRPAEEVEAEKAILEICGLSEEVPVENVEGETPEAIMEEKTSEVVMEEAMSIKKRDDVIAEENAPV